MPQQAALRMMETQAMVNAEVRSTLARIEAKLDILLAREGRAADAAQPSSIDLVLLSSLTTKQHAIVQMMLRDASTAEIASRLDLSENTVKTHIAMIVRKLGVDRKIAAISKLAPVFDRVPPAAYMEASGGLPKDWDANYSPSDPANKLLKSSREES